MTAAHNPVPRFALVGCVNFCVSFLVFYFSYHYLPLREIVASLHSSADGPFHELRIDGAAANVLAYLAGMVNSFFLNRSWTFRAAGNPTGQVVRFVLVSLFSLTLSTVTVFRFVDMQGYPELAVWIPLAMVIMVLNYLGCRHWAFATPALRSSESR